MIVLLCLLSFIEPEGPGWVRELEIYRPIYPGLADVSDAGITYVLDRDEASVWRIDDQGNLLDSFAREGKGPGELERPMSLDILDDRIFIQAIRAVHVFDLEGAFIEKVTPPGRIASLRRLKGGWLGTQYGFRMPGASETPPSKLFWVSLDLGEETLLREWQSSIGSAFTPGGPMKLNPAPERAIMAFDQTGQRAFLRFPEEGEFHILDGARGEIIGSVEVPFERIPFDEAWGMERVAAMKKRMADRGLSEVEADLPDYYPTIAGMTWLSEGCLSVVQRTGGSEDPSRTLYYDAKGNPVTPVYGMRGARILAIREGMAWVCVFDNDEETASIAYRPVEGIEALLPEEEGGEE